MLDFSNQISILLAEATESASEVEPTFAVKASSFVLVMFVVLWLLSLARKGYDRKVFTNMYASSAEQLFLFLDGFAINIIGPHGRKYLPMLGTFWLYIFVANVLGLFLPYTPTADLSLNLGMAIVAIMYVQFEGIKTNGVIGHFKHFSGPKLTGIMVLVSVMIFMIEIVSETMKMLSLSLRLYGNIHGGHEVVKNLNKLGALHLGPYEAQIPIGGLLIPIKLLTCLVQALVFTLLFSVYLSLVTHHEDDHGAHGEAAHA